MPFRAAHNLVEQDLRIRQREPLSFLACGEKKRAHRCRNADAHRRNVRADKLHRIVDSHAGRHRATRAIDIQADLALRILVVEEEQLRDDDVCDRIVDRAAEENDALL